MKENRSITLDSHEIVVFTTTNPDMKLSTFLNAQLIRFNNNQSDSITNNKENVKKALELESKVDRMLEILKELDAGQGIKT